MKLSDYVVDCLVAQGVPYGFFMIGGALGHLADSCARKGFKLYTLHHEQAAAFAAEGAAALTHCPGVAMATSGPGATNLVTGIGSAYFASHPMIFITGQVNTYESNLNGKRRQVGFQETDIVSIARPITKYAKQVTDPSSVAYEVEKAFFIAMSGRMGPVLLDFPFDVQKAEISPESQRRFIGSPEHAQLLKKPFASGDSLAKVASLIQSSKRPMVLVGHGARLSRAEQHVLSFIEKTKIPLVATLMGTDVVANDHGLYYGFIGTYGQRAANLALANSDLIIVLGARLDSRQVGVRASEFAPVAKIVHVDIDPSELGASVREEVSIESDITDFIDALMPLLPSFRDRAEWTGFLDSMMAKYSTVDQDAGRQISPKLAISLLCDASKEGDAVCVDVGSHQMWFAQAWKVKKRQFVLTNGGMGPMGCALPSAIGISLSKNSAPVWVVVGDGSMQLNIQELQTVVRHKLPIKIMVINNLSLGMLTQFQTENFGGRMIGSVDGYDAPDFVKVALAYGLSARRVQEKEELRDGIGWLSAQDGPALLDVRVPQNFWVLPKASHKLPVHQMAPFLNKSELAEALKFLK